MFCTKCGNPIKEGDKFCPICGAKNEADTQPPAQEYEQAPYAEQEQEQEQVIPAAQEQEQEQNVPAEQETQDEVCRDAEQAPLESTAEPSRKKLGKGAVIGVVAAAAVLIAAIVGVLLLFAGNPKAKVGAAAVKSLKAYAEVMDSLGASDIKKLYESNKITSSASLELRSDPYYGEKLKGLGISSNFGYSLSDRKMDFSAAFTYGSADIITAQAKLDDSVLSVYVPELFDDTAYSIDMMTLGKDLDNFTDELPDELSKLSFNVFDIIETLKKDEPSGVDKNEVRAFIKAISVEKLGKNSIEVNDRSIACTKYRVVIPEDAMKDYIDAMKDAYKVSDFIDKVIEILESAGLPKYVTAEIKASSKDGGGEIFDALKDAVKKLGDLELDVYIKGGYVTAVEWEDKIDGVKSSLGLYLGGGKEYVDDLSMELRVGDEGVEISSSGNRSVKKGAFTDSTTIRLKDGGGYHTIKSETEYDPKKSSDNFSFTLKDADEEFSMKADGQLDMGKDGVDLQLDKLSVKDEYGDEFSVRLAWSVKPFSEQKLEAQKTKAVLQMSQTELMYLLMDIESNAEQWSESIASDYEDLFRDIGNMF